MSGSGFDDDLLPYQKESSGEIPRLRLAKHFLYTALCLPPQRASPLRLRQTIHGQQDMGRF
ncbi:hypothetical protein HOC_00270 [Hyphomonas oceanitis SCH89]|uniref:Uncharacterized protein n=1 Tax=Hyphomonas oceanitis SCH89 TaxID=1280953 RepID=A0A059GCQ1_9PROT|nr:hypothetical protein HOC_00270 [Hyphomonas oceanitis SCH89]